MTESRVFYAVGDVHGENVRLARLHDMIAQRHRDQFAGRPASLVHLGDYIDRGPDSAGVIERLIAIQAAPPPDFEVVSLRGNHEQMMIDAFGPNPSKFKYWDMNGGQATIDSYLDAYSADLAPDAPAEAIVPEAHRLWLNALPLIVRPEGTPYVFVHAGIEPEDFPDCDPAVYLWTRREAFFNTGMWPKRPELDDILVVHGHTPPRDFRPEWIDRRINVDTGAVYGGPLTAVVLATGARPRFLSVPA